MTEESTALVRHAEQLDDLRAALTKQSAAAIQLLPPDDVKRIFRVVIESCRRTPALLECSRASIVRSAMMGVELGLEVGGVMGEAYLVPYREKGTKEAQVIIGYKGLVVLAKRDGLDIEARLVHGEDPFEVHLGTDPSIFHKPTWKGDIVHSYAVAFGTRPQFEVMTIDELNRIRDDSLSKIKDEWKRNKSPWMTNRDEMYRKTPVRRLAKTLGLTGRLKRAIELEDEQHAEPAKETFTTGRVDDLKSKLAGAPDADYKEG